VIFISDSQMWIVRVKAQDTRHAKVTTTEYQLVKSTVFCTNKLMHGFNGQLFTPCCCSSVCSQR